MPLSAEEISKRYESTCKRIQDSILVMESCLGRNSKYDFDFNKVIGNLQQTNTHEEEDAISMMIHALEEYNKFLNPILDRVQDTPKMDGGGAKKPPSLTLPFGV